MKGKDYIFDELPYDVWEKFKNSDDLGKTYHKIICMSVISHNFVYLFDN